MMNRLRKFCLMFGLILGSHLASDAGFTFQTNLREVTVKPDAKSVEMLFPFKNETKETVEIRKYDAPCSCMSAKLKGGKQTGRGTIAFGPGESGVVKGLFELGNFKGTVDKQIVIWTSKDKENAPSVKLTTRVTIPELVLATPKSLVWDLGGEPKAKEISIKVTGDKPIKITSSECSNESIEFKVTTIKEGFEYKVMVKPRTTESVVFAALRFTTDSKIDRFKLVQTFMTVKPKKE